MTWGNDREDRFGIDDFTWVVDDPAGIDGRPPRSAFTSWLLRATGFALLVAGGIWALAHLAGFAVPYVLLVAVLLAGAGLRRILGDLRPPPLRFVTDAPLVARAAVIPGELSDGLELATIRWDNRLSFGERDAGRFASSIRPRITELVDERLRQRHGLTRASDPARARELLGEPLWELLHAPSVRNPSPRQLAAIIAKVEEL
jgi:hypothetical protein